MNELTLEWQEAGHRKTHTIYEQQASKNPGTVRIGRDPAQCDILLTHPTVSKLHVEIFFHPQQQRFYLRNLRGSNPALVDGKYITQGEVVLSQGSTISLGQQQIIVIAVLVPANKGIPDTVLSTPQPQVGQNHQHYQVPISSKTYGLMCPNPNCRKISAYEQLNFGCPWCGRSLAAAVSVLSQPVNN